MAYIIQDGKQSGKEVIQFLRKKSVFNIKYKLIYILLKHVSCLLFGWFALNIKIYVS